MENKDKYFSFYFDSVVNLKEHITKNVFKGITLKYKSPIVLIKNDELIVNPCLKEYKFFKYMDAYTIYQELEMFVGNDLVRDTKVEVPVGSDKVLAASKGYDKYSFRKDKSKGK